MSLTELKFTGESEFHPLSILMSSFRLWKCVTIDSTPPPLNPYSVSLISFVACMLRLKSITVDIYVVVMSKVDNNKTSIYFYFNLCLYFCHMQSFIEDQGAYHSANKERLES